MPVGSPNLVLRVALALSIVFVAVGMTFAAPNSLGPSAAVGSAPVASPVAVAGYQAAPIGSAADRAATSSSSPQEAATLVALATTIVLLAIFAILLSYRPRPGGVRAQQR
jgi:hypothetical protein